MSENNNTTKNNTNALLLCTANMITTFHSTTETRFSSQDHTMIDPSPVGMNYLSTPALVPGVGFVLERTWRSVAFAEPFPLPPSRLNCSAPPICLFRLAGVERRAETNCRPWTLLITVMKYLEVWRAWSRPYLVYHIERSPTRIMNSSPFRDFWYVDEYRNFENAGRLFATHSEGKTILKSLNG